MRTAREIAELLNVNKQTIYRIIRNNDLKGTQNPNRSNTLLYDDDVFEIIKSFVDSYKSKNIDIDANSKEIQILKLEMNFKNEKILLLEDKIKSLEDLISNQKLTIDILMKQNINS